MANRKLIDLSIATDFNGGRGDPAASLKAIAEAGFTHVHWCHRWTGLYEYPRAEISYIAHLLKTEGLQLLDVHASDGGREGHCWISSYLYERMVGMNLIENRMRFAADLGGRAIVLHAPVEPDNQAENTLFWSIMDQNLEQITKWAREYDVKVAVEQTDTKPMNLPTLLHMLERSDPEHIGICLDSGHGEIHGNNHELLTMLGGRLYALHLNDNHGPTSVPGVDPDIHLLPFDGRIDWNEFTNLLRDTVYTGPLSFEVSYSRYRDRMSVNEYLELAFKKASALHEMVNHNNA